MEMRITNKSVNWLRCFLVLVLTHAYLLPPSSLAETPYYEGKTITILRGGSPGGYGTLQAQALMPYLKKYIPGNPFIFIDHMPGAAGRKASKFTFYLTTVASDSERTQRRAARQHITYLHYPNLLPDKLNTGGSYD